MPIYVWISYNRRPLALHCVRSLHVSDMHMGHPMYVTCCRSTQRPTPLPLMRQLLCRAAQQVPRGDENTGVCGVRKQQF
jgi:hypothetical protein